MASTFSVHEAEHLTLASGFARHLGSIDEGKNGTLRAIEPYFLRPGDEDIWRGAAGIFASARDLTKWVGMLMNKGKDIESGKEIVKEAVLKDVERGVTVIKQEPDYEEFSAKVYGAGVRRYTYQGKEVVGE
jgi:CubicO group peptidase (beta-lactamase class C family)